MDLVLVGVDGSECSKIALRWAVDEARRRDARLRAVFVPSGSFWHGKDFTSPESVVEEAESRLESAMDEVVGEGPAVDVEQRIVGGNPREVLAEMSTEADLLVVGSRGHGNVAGLLLGSVSHYLVAHAKCPVTVVRDKRQ